MSTAQDYLGAIVRRARDRMEPADFEVDWADMPRRGKLYLDVPQLVLDEVTEGDPAEFNLSLLAGMLADTYAESDRRLAVHANSDVDDLPRYHGASFSRGVASGGGRYPVSIYLVSGPTVEPTPGLYYYSTNHHSLQRLITGDLTPGVADAVGQPAAQYLVLGIKFWQNAFKYNSFCYHAVTMDIGTITEAWRWWAREHGLELKPALWFDEPALSELLGLDPADEGVFAVIPLTRTAPPSEPAPPPPVRVTACDHEISRTVLRFQAVTDMQQAALQGCADRPNAEQLRSANRVAGPGGVELTLPDPLQLRGTAREALSARRSSFGRFTSTVKTTTQELSTMLAAGIRAGRFPSDVADELDLVTLFVFVNHVEGVPAGAYRYEPTGNRLVRVAEGAFGEFLQFHYYLENYNLEQAGVVIVPAVRAAAVLSAVGDRGYRLVNAVVGAVTQALYLTAADVGIGCGAALGFDNVAYQEVLGIADTDTVPLIIVMAGHDRQAQAAYRYELHR